MSFGLGRGLEALIPTNKKTNKPAPDLNGARLTGTAQQIKPSETGQLEVPIDKIMPNPMQPRKQFNLKKLQELADSLKEHGLIEPLVVSPGEQEGTYILVAGERRLRAAELAGLPRLAVSVRKTSSQEKLELALVENIQRQELNPLEEARAIKKLMREFGLNQEQAAEKIGRSRPALSNCLRLLELAPEVKKALLNEKISAGHARALLGLDSHAKQVEVMRQVIDLSMSVRTLERLVRRLSKPLSHRARLKVSEVGRDSRTDEIAKRLGSALGAKVEIVSAPKGSRIVIEYYSVEELQRITDLVIGGGNKSVAGRRGRASGNNYFSV